MVEQTETNNKLQQLNNLHTFLEKFRINKSESKQIKSTHISMGKYMGSFNIPDDKLNEFNKLYKRVIKTNIIPNILESHLEQGPIIIDIDLKYTIKSDLHSRIYTTSDIKNILEIYNKVICTFLYINPDDLNIYISEKSTPKIILVNDVSGSTTYKDGLHIIYPDICVNNRVQFFFRELVVNRILEDNLLTHLNLDNTIDDVFDKAIIERNNWLLYGSCKDSNPDNLYKLTKIYDYNLLEQEPEENDLISYLSIRKFKSVEDNTEYVNDMSFEKINYLYGELIGKNPNKKPLAMNSDIKRAKILLGMLNESRAKNYSDWIEIGFCLHNIDDYLLLDEWIEFSKKSLSTYKAGECEKLWNNFKYEGLTIRSLYRWAKEDNPDAYSDFLLDDLDDIIKGSLDISSYSVARVFYEFNKYQYVCTSVSKKKWYEYTNNKWEPMDEANTIIKKLNTELANQYIKLSTAYNQKALTSVADDKKNMLNKSQIATKIANKLHEMSFKKNVIAELCIMYYDSKFMEKLDENRYLIGFSNGVYDLKNNYFRNGIPEDYISMSTKCNYINYDESNKDIISVLNFFEQIQPDEQMREYLLTKLSSFLEGIQRDQKFEIWTGTGANGKGRIIKLILDSFGEYACTIPVTLLTKPRADSNNASPALALTKGKRCCIFQEPENDDKIYVGHMKNLTGGDKLMARSLYSDPVEFYPQFKTILACNKLPDIPSADGGTWRRIRVVPFEVKFVDNPTESCHRKKVNDIDDQIEKWTSAFMSILIEKYKTYINNGVTEPSKVLMNTHQYQNNSDVFMEYIGDNIKSTDNNKDLISADEIWQDFKRWHKDSNRNKIPAKSEFKNEMEIRLGKFKNNKFYYYRFKTEDDEDDENQTITEKLNSSFNTSNVNSSIYINKQLNSEDNLILDRQEKKSSLKKISSLIDFDYIDDDEIDNIFIKNNKTNNNIAIKC